jgi:hypothetical protein
MGLYGPGAATASTAYGATGAGAAVGIYIGGDPAGAISPSNNNGNGLLFEGLAISNFAIGIQLGNNTWGHSYFDATISTNGTGFFIPSNVSNTGELITFHGGVFANNSVVGLSNQNGSETHFFGTAFDYNAQAISGGSPGGGPYIGAFGAHFEQTSGVFIDSGGSPSLTLSGCGFLYNGGSGLNDTAMITVHSSYPTITVNGVNAYAGHTTGYFLALTRTTTPTTPVSIQNVSFSGGVAALTNAALPRLLQSSAAGSTCSANNRGTISFVAGGNGAADSIQVCSKLANGTYSWVIH